MQTKYLFCRNEPAYRTGKCKSLNDVTVVNIWVWSLLFEIAQDTKQFDWGVFFTREWSNKLDHFANEKLRYSVHSCANLTSSNSIS